MELHDTARERRAHMADKETLLSQKKVTLRQCIDRSISFAEPHICSFDSTVVSFFLFVSTSVSLYLQVEGHGKYKYETSSGIAKFRC